MRNSKEEGNRHSPNRMKYTKTPKHHRTWVLPEKGVEEGRKKGDQKRIHSASDSGTRHGTHTRPEMNEGKALEQSPALPDPGEHPHEGGLPKCTVSVCDKEGGAGSRGWKACPEPSNSEPQHRTKSWKERTATNASRERARMWKTLT